jgi:spermidine synthase
LDTQSRGWQWPGRQVAATVDSPYALLTATREKEQYSFFANHVWHFTHPDPVCAEHAVHPALLEHPHPEQVLLLGGGAAGLIPEVLKHQSVKQLHYVELDPELVRLAARLAPEAARHLSGEPRTAVFYQDARRFLALSDQRYDVILLNLPEPGNAQLNRFYSREFFLIAARRLKPQGIFSFALSGGGSASLSPSRAAYLALGYHTLKRAFPEVLALPGEQVRFFGSLGQGVLTADPEVLAARLKERRLDLRYVREYYLLADLAPSRQQYLSAVLSRQPLEVNTDLHPRGYFYDLLLTSAREGLPLPGVLVGLRSLPWFVPLVVFGLGLALVWATPRKWGGLHSLAQVLVMGMGTMALEVTVLILYQVHLGYLYRQLGLLVAAFMAGLWAGGTWGERRRGDLLSLTRSLAALQGSLAGLSLLLAGALWSISQAPLRVLPELILQGGFILFLALAGFMGGGIFSISASLWRQAHPAAASEGGLFYAVDLLGATLGTLGMSLIILPVWGILPALLGLAALHALAAVLMARF